MKQKAATKEQIVALLEQAELCPEAAKKHVALARKLSSHFKVKIPVQWRRRFCKVCDAFWVPGTNCRVRTRAKGIVITCLECGKIRRIKRRAER